METLGDLCLFLNVSLTALSQFPRYLSTFELSTMSLPKVSHIIKGLVGDAMDIDLPVYGDDFPAVEATSLAADQQPSDDPEVPESLSSAVAPMRHKKRNAKVLPRDTRLELRNADLLGWQTGYLKTMKQDTQKNINKRIKQQAKKNAEYYVWSAGIGGLGRDRFGARGPLNQFVGDNLFELLLGRSSDSNTTSKRSRDSAIDEDTRDEARRKRQKNAELQEEIGRGGDGEGIMIGGDEEIELPREAVSPLDDQQLFSAMPWNISASKRGSSALLLSGRVTMMSEQGKHGSRGGSRMVSASPLLRRSTGRAGDFEALQSFDSDALGGDEFAYAVPTSDPFGAGEEVMYPSLRVREALSAEGENFFAFVSEAIVEKRERELARMAQELDVHQDEVASVEMITFDELLPPDETSKMIACQGFLMLLSLGTKGMLNVEQPSAFDDMTLKLTDKAKAMQVIQIRDGDEEDPPYNEEIVDAPTESVADKEQDSVTEAGDDAELPQRDNSQFRE